MNYKKGFTLLEILLVVGIIAILAGIVIVAINPSKQLAMVRNTERKSDIKQINNALQQYYIDHKRYPTSTPATLTEICNTGTDTYPTDETDCTNLDLVDLSILVPTYITAIPVDPQGGISFLNNFITKAYAAATGGNGYKIMLDSSRKVVITANRAEYNAVIAIGTTTVANVNGLSACESYTYTDWGACSNSSQSRTQLTSVPENCIGGSSPVLTQSCDSTAPTVTAFTIPATASSLTVSISTFTATDAVGVTGYLVNESASTPSAGSGSWVGTAPTSYTFSTEGSKTLYAWAKDADGNVSTSLSDSVTITIPTVPAAPTIGTATAGNATATVAFTPGSDGGSAITSYQVTSNPGSLTATGASSPITITGLTNGTAYTFTVKAINAIGTSTASAASNSVTPADPIVTALRSGLIAYYPLNGNATDNSGSNNNGTWTGTAAYTTGNTNLGQTAVFNGSSIITSGSNVGISGTSARTLNAWIKSSSSGWYGFTSFGSAQWGHTFTLMHTDNNSYTYRIAFYFGGYGYDIVTSSVINNGTWHMLTASYSGTNVNLYVDGSPISARQNINFNDPIPLNTTNSPLVIGAQFDGSTKLTGNVDEVGLWNRVLSGSEITDLYNSGAGRSLVQ